MLKRKGKLPDCFGKMDNYNIPCMPDIITGKLKITLTIGKTYPHPKGCGITVLQSLLSIDSVSIVRKEPLTSSP